MPFVDSGSPTILLTRRHHKKILILKQFNSIGTFTSVLTLPHVPPLMSHGVSSMQLLQLRHCIWTAVLHEPSDFGQDASNITCAAREYFSWRRNKQMTVKHDKMFIISIQLHVSASIRFLLCLTVICLFIPYSLMHNGMYMFKKNIFFFRIFYVWCRWE